MTELRDKHPLPDVDAASLIMDVEFTETEEEIDVPILDSFEEVQTSKKYGAVELPKSLTTPQGRARIVTVINQKGGVGKTTAVINIAAQLALRGYNILVIDADSQGNCATGLGVDKSKVRETTRDLILNPESVISARHATAVDKLHLIVGVKNLIGLEQEIFNLSKTFSLKSIKQNENLIDGLKKICRKYTKEKTGKKEIEKTEKLGSYSPYFFTFSINVVLRSFKSFAASLVFPLFRLRAASIKTISISLRSNLKSTELFVSNQFEKSSGVGKLLSSFSSKETGAFPNSSNSVHIAVCSSALVMTLLLTEIRY